MKNRTKVDQSLRINRRLKNKENELLHQKETNLTEKGITTMKNQQAVEGDTIVIVEVLAIEAITVETITRIMT